MPNASLFRNTQFLLSGRPHIHIILEDDSDFYLGFFRWTKENHPESYRYFRFSILGKPMNNRMRWARLLVPWVQDPVRERSSECYASLVDIEAQYSQQGITIINRVDSLSNTIKTRALALAAECDLKCARIIPCDQSASFNMLSEKLGVPFIVRSNFEHAAPMYKIHYPCDMDAIKWGKLGSAAASEFIETRSNDGFYRKYRYVMFGNQGIPRHLVICDGWWVHAKGRERRPDIIEEEITYINSEQDPFHDQLDQYRQRLGLDYVAFDYSIDDQGELVVWEPNPFPLLWTPYNECDNYFDYQRTHMDKLYTMHLKWLLEQANLPTNIA